MKEKRDEIVPDVGCGKYMSSTNFGRKDRFGQSNMSQVRPDCFMENSRRLTERESGKKVLIPNAEAVSLEARRTKG